MASVFVRGPKSAPRFYGRIKAADGRWISRRIRQQTRRDALRVAQALEARAERQRLGLEPPESVGLLMRELLERFQASLTNRSWRDDVSRIKHHVLPRWGGVRVVDVDLPAVMRWIDEMRADARIAPGTQRHALGLLSRCFSWAIARGLAQSNPVRLVPTGARPQAAPNPDDQAWIADDELPRTIVAALPEPYSLAWYVAFTSGARMGEVFGLKVADLDGLAEGYIRVAGSFGGPLKEDKKGTGKVKFIPAARDAGAVLGHWLARRRAEGAGPDDLVFPGPDGRVMPRYLVAYQWRKARRALGLALSWHKSTRTSAASRWARANVPLDQIAAALGHANTSTTSRSYQKYRRKTFDPRMTGGLVPPGGGNVIALSPPTAPAAEHPENERPMKTEDEHAA